jgi:hypothetical protein
MNLNTNILRRALVVKTNKNKGCAHTMALPFTLKSILRQKKNCGNSNISPCKKYNLQKVLFKKTKIIQDIITL